MHTECCLLFLSNRDDEATNYQQCQKQATMKLSSWLAILATQAWLSHVIKSSCYVSSRFSTSRYVSDFLQRAKLHCKRCISYGNSVRLSVRLSVCLSICHTPVLCQNEGT